MKRSKTKQVKQGVWCACTQSNGAPAPIWCACTQYSDATTSLSLQIKILFRKLGAPARGYMVRPHQTVLKRFFAKWYVLLHVNGCIVSCFCYVNLPQYISEEITYEMRLENIHTFLRRVISSRSLSLFIVKHNLQIHYSVYSFHQPNSIVSASYLTIVYYELFGPSGSVNFLQESVLLRMCLELSTIWFPTRYISIYTLIEPTCTLI